MPPDLDVYVRSRRRDRETIERFITRWIDRSKSENRGDEELMMLPLDRVDEPSPSFDWWDWEPARTLAHIVERGLQVPHRAFTTYSKTTDPRIVLAYLTFTSDGMVIFGVSVPDEGGTPEKLAIAKTLLHELAEDVDADAGYVTYEEPPPLSASCFPREDERFVAYRWKA